MFTIKNLMSKPTYSFVFLLNLLTASQLVVAGTAITTGTMDPSISCIEATCGRVNPLSHPFETDPSLQEKIEEIIQTKMKRPVEIYMGRLINSAVLQDKAFKMVKENIQNINLSSEQDAFLQSYLYLNKFNDVLNSAIERKQYVYTINPDTIKSLLPNISEPELNAILSLNKTINIAMRLMSLSRSNYESFIRTLNPQMNLIEGQKNEAIKIIFTQTQLTQIIPLYSNILLDSIVLNKALKGDALTLAESKIMIDEIIRSNWISALLEDQVQVPFKKLKLNITNTFNEADTKYQSSEVALALKNPKSIKALLQKNEGLCFNELTYSYAALPSKSQIENFKNILIQIEGKARSLIEEKTKLSLAQSFNGEVYLPTAKEDIIEEWTSGLSINVDKSEKALKTLKSIDSSNRETLNSLFMIFVGFQKNNLFDDVLSFCKKAEPPFLSDNANRITQAITLSWPTIVHPELGAAIIAHELGHTVSFIWPQAVKTEKDCLISRQGTSQFVEEDFADLFSAEIFNQFSGKINEINLSNLGCGLIPRSSDGWDQNSLVNTDTTDPHSSGFYRLIATGTMTSNLKPECANYLKNSGETKFNNYCSWQK